MLVSLLRVSRLSNPRNSNYLSGLFLTIMSRRRDRLRLREHPRLSRNGRKSWPPKWTWIGGAENKKPKGEIGILREVKISKMMTPNKCFIVIDHEGSVYMGTLFINDLSLFVRIVALLRDHCGKRLREIGNLDVSHIL